MPEVLADHQVINGATAISSTSKQTQAACGFQLLKHHVPISGDHELVSVSTADQRSGGFGHVFRAAGIGSRRHVCRNVNVPSSRLSLCMQPCHGHIRPYGHQHSQPLPLVATSCGVLPAPCEHFTDLLDGDAAAKKALLSWLAKNLSTLELRSRTKCDSTNDTA